MTDEQINEQPTPETETEEEEQPAAEPAVAADADGWHTELVLESQRYVWLVTAPDGSTHVARSEDELDALKAEHGK